MKKQSDARVPGWKIVRSDGSSTVRYLSPNGTEVGAWAYNTVYKHWQKTGTVPQDPIGDRYKFFQKRTPSSPINNHTISGDIGVNDDPDTESVIPIPIPEPKNTSSTRKSGLFSSRDLSSGFASLLVIMTAIVAQATQIPEAQMTEVEVKAISIPLGNIVERSKYNKTIGNVIVDKYDWVQLGYALYTYIDRVGTAYGEKARANKKPTGNTGGVTGPQDNNSNGYNPGISLRPASKGAGWVNFPH